MSSTGKHSIDLVSESNMDTVSKDDVKPYLSTPVHLENWRTAGFGLDIGEIDHTFLSQCSVSNGIVLQWQIFPSN